LTQSHDIKKTRHVVHYPFTVELHLLLTPWSEINVWGCRKAHAARNIYSLPFLPYMCTVHSAISQ